MVGIVSISKISIISIISMINVISIISAWYLSDSNMHVIIYKKLNIWLFKYSIIIWAYFADSIDINL